MGTITVGCWVENRALTRASLEALGAGRRLAESRGDRLTATVVGADVAGAARDAASAGASTVYVVENPILAEYQAELYLEAVAAAIQEAAPSVILMTGETAAREVGPRLAHRLKAAVLTEVVDLRAVGGDIEAVRPEYGGKSMAVYTATCEPLVIILRPKTQEPAELDEGRQVDLVRVPWNAAESLAVSRVVERIQEALTGVKLSDARVVVAGGRGVGGPEPFVELGKLAAVLGGAMGASRAACDAGWISAQVQVGQTGQIVAPDLYIAIGISGASQHLAGISGARTVVAINKDPEAPIFKRANLGIVADYRTVLPVLTSQLQAIVDQ